MSEIIAIGEFIAADRPSAAASWVARLLRRVEYCARVPFAGRVVPELGRDDIREVIVRSYRIVYRVTTDSLEVLTVFEGHRRIGLDPADE